MAKRRSYGPYKMTARRRYALKKAQEASARKRRRQRNKKIGIAAGAIAGIAVAGVLGSRYGSSRIQQSVKNKRIQAMTAHRSTAQKLAHYKKISAPDSKEATRIANAMMNARPSATTNQGPSRGITEGDRARAENTRKQLNRAIPPPAHMRGATDAQTNRSVRRTLKEARKATQGKKSESLTGTPGGTKTPMKAIPHKPETWKDEDWADALAFDTLVRQPIAGPPAQRKSMSSSVPQRDPLHTLAKQRFEDSKLLGAGNKVSGADDPFLANVGTSRKAARKPKRK